MPEPRLIDGRAVAATTLARVREQVAGILAAGQRPPGLAVVLVGEDPASRAYVRNKAKTCAELGLFSVKHELPAETTQVALLDLIAQLNADPAVDGILVQSPPPRHIDESAVVLALDPAKDVDGFHPVNVAKLALGDPSGFVPCTPLGCQRLLAAADVPVPGAHVVILGRSLIVGKSLALLLMQKGPHADATVTVAHSRSQNLPALCREADILVAAIGRAGFVTADMVREGAVVIDVGINRVTDPSAKSGSRLVGDVDFAAVAPRCAAITPVPGGVGPMTIAMLMSNTLQAYRQRTKIEG